MDEVREKSELKASCLRSACLVLAFRLIVFEFHIVVLAFHMNHQKPHGHVVSSGLDTPYLILTSFYPKRLWINLTYQRYARCIKCGYNSL